MFRNFENRLFGRKLTIDTKLESIDDIKEVLENINGTLIKGNLIYDDLMGYSCMGVDKDEILSIIGDKFTDKCEEFYNNIYYQAYIGKNSEKHYFNMQKGISLNSTEILSASIDLYLKK
jgi:hypothetical protein